MSNKSKVYIGLGESNQLIAGMMKKHFVEITVNKCIAFCQNFCI